MKVRIGQNAHDVDIGRYGFSFDSVEPDGTRKYTARMNAIWTSRIEETIVNIYSHEAGTRVEELTVEPQSEWAQFPPFNREEYEREERERLESMNAAWDELVQSLPDDQTEALRTATADAKELVYRATLDPVEYPEDGCYPLAEAQEAVDRVKEIFPASNIASILRLIVEFDASMD